MTRGIKHTLFFKPVIAASLSACLVTFASATEITNDKQLEAMISSAIDVTEGKAGIAIKNTSHTPLVITLNPNGTIVNVINNGSGNAFGIHAVGNVIFDGQEGKSLTFDSITASGGRSVGIQANSLSFTNGIDVNFKEIKNDDSFRLAIGIDGESNNPLNLSLSNGSKLTFTSISKSGNGTDGARGDAFGMRSEGNTLNLTLTGDSTLEFKSIASTDTNSAVGIRAKEMNINTAGGTLRFDSITSAGDDATGLLLMAGGRATIAENSKIFFDTITSGNTTDYRNYVIFEEDKAEVGSQGRGITFNKNASIIYGDIKNGSDYNTANTYGIFHNASGYYSFSAKTEATKNNQGSVFSEINATTGDAYGMYLGSNASILGTEGKLTFREITSQVGNVYGMYFSGNSALKFTDSKTATLGSIVFDSITSQSKDAIGIQAQSLNVDNVSLTFNSITKIGTQKANVSIYGIYSSPNQGLNLTLVNNASIEFKSISGTNDFNYATGIATGLKATSSKIDTSGGKLSFGTISSVESAAGITFQAQNNELVGEILFTRIESTGELIFNGSPIARHAYGVSFSPSASATFKENAKIYIGSMDSKGNIYPLFAHQAKSLTFEKNAGLFYGAITEDQKTHSYGIYANANGKTLNYYFGAGDTSGTPGSFPVDPTGTTFKGIEATDPGKNAYGIHLANTTGKHFNINGKARFELIASQAGNAYGIYAQNDVSLVGVAGGSKDIVFETIVSETSGDAIGLEVAQNASLTIDQVKLGFDGIVSGDEINGLSNEKKSYAIKNKGMLILKEAGLLTFGNPAGDSTTGFAIRNSLVNIGNKGLIYDFGTIIIGDGASPVALQYGFYNVVSNVNLSGKFEVKNFEATDKFSLIYQGGVTAGAMKIDNLSISAYGDKTSTELYGFHSDIASIHLDLTNTLNITLMNDANRYEAIDTARSEGIAFGDNVSLNLGENAKVIFNAGGGTLTSLSGNEGKILLSGEKISSSRNTQEYTNRIWLDQNVKRNFNFRHLEIRDLQAQNIQFVLYADKDAKVANGNDGPFGKAYAEGATKQTDRTEFGGSDGVTISGATGMGEVSNNLVIALGGLNNQNKDKVQNVLLAIVDASVSDKVSFNGLKKSGDSVMTESYVGFDVADLEIKRQDTASGTSYYYSSLATHNARINTQYLAPIFNSLNINFFTLSNNLNSLSKRLGDLKNDANSHGVWARVFGGEQVANFGIKTTQSYVTTQVGYDYGLDLNHAKNYLGIALSYGYGSSKQVEANYTGAQGFETYQNSAITHSVEVALYNTYKTNGGLYSDSIAKFGYLTSDINFYKNNKISAHSNIAVALSEEVGYEFALGKNKEWMIIPQAELAYAFMNGSEFSQTQTGGSLSATSDALHLLRMRAGANWGYRFNNVSDPEKIKTLLYVGTYYEYDVISGGDMKFSSSNHGNAVNYNDLTSNGRFVLNLGTDMQVQESTRIYIDFEKSFGSSLQKEYQVNFGVRYAFGEKKQEVLKMEEDQKALLKLEEKEQKDFDQKVNAKEIEQAENTQETQEIE